MKAVLFYYSQSGQALRAAENICKGFDKTDVVCKEIVPLEHYPFPWSRREFFEVFPETRLGICPSGIAPLNLEDVRMLILCLLRPNPGSSPLPYPFSLSSAMKMLRIFSGAERLFL